ncbi:MULTISPECIES: hypothetical protein [Chelativorans]|nr:MULTISPECIES: hypothetical protein [Chelativorans]
MSENTKLWDILGRTDPKHTTRFKRGGGFSGTAIKPMWSYRRLTEEFGPCGTGWGVNEPVFQVVPGDNREVLVYCTVSGWYMWDGERRAVFGVGGDKVVTHIKANTQYNRPERWENDDEAFKKAFTDALTNAFKLLGVGADVHMGMFDDNKYVNTMQQEFAEEAAGSNSEPPRKANGRPETGWREDGTRTPYSLRQEKVWDEFQQELLEVHTGAGLKQLAEMWRKKADDDKWPESWKALVKEELEKRRLQLRAEAAKEPIDYTMAG